MQVGLVPSTSLDAIRPLICGILRAAGIDLVTDEAWRPELEGLIEVCDGTACTANGPCYPISTYRFELRDRDPKTATVTFADSTTLPPLLRGLQLHAQAVPEPVQGCPRGSEVLARSDSGALWISSRSPRYRHDTAVLSRSALREGASLAHVLNGDRFTEFLPLVEWARSIAGWAEWRRPPIRACLMIDDPNLHWTTYGYVSYKDVAEAGGRHKFHTSFATIPLDQYYVNRTAAKLFQTNRDSISLLVHGNNHTYRELAVMDPAAPQLGEIIEAISRIERLERKADLAVSRVMAPPHGACSESMMRCLAHAGFEAACISHGSVRAANVSPGWSQGLGADPTMVIHGLPVIPRFPLGKSSQNQLVLSAYLEQPIIGVGHHQDLQNGIGGLAEPAAAINSLGEVLWTDMARIARGNFFWKEHAGEVLIRAFSRRFRLQVAAGVNRATIKCPSADGSDFEAACEDVNSGALFEGVRKDNGWSFALPGGASVEISVFPVGEAPRQPEKERAASFRARVVVRRGMTELRDRLLPWLRPTRAPLRGRPGLPYRTGS